MAQSNKQIKSEMIKIYKINKLGFDFAGYTFNNKNELSYHHTIIPKRDGGLSTFENGSILNQQTSHDYLHYIELYDEEIFNLITKQLIEENLNQKIDIQNLRRIRDLLIYFEKEHCSTRTKKGKLLIKEDYLWKRIKL